ncbi:MAG TPA: GSCFA domain-containing protein [Cyclobacteriaceae bacterium]
MNTPFLTLGSCFADGIGQRLEKNKFSVLPNPFGTIYNPHSIHKLLHYAIADKIPPEYTYLKQGEVFLNYDFHSEFSALSQAELVKKIEASINTTHAFLKNTSYLILTYGTSWIYERRDISEVVANCHKKPAAEFTKSLLTQKKIIESFQDVYTALTAFNPSLKIILTVSPVRHIKDTLELNSVSKSVLRMACHTISTTYTDVEYFPAYEIMLDDLRDYRFYKADMIHPTEEAVNYIWDAFIETYASEDLKNFLKQWKEIQTAMAHKPFHPSTAAHQKFLHDLLKKLELLSTKVDVKSEINLIQNQKL